MSLELSREEGEFLVKLARDAIEQYIREKKIASIPPSTSEKLMQPYGVFVTINIVEKGEKKLRGCIGYPYPIEPLAKAVVQSAISAATGDPRFYPLSPNEIDKTILEISILTPPQRLDAKKPTEYLTKIRIGEDGLIVEKGMCKGLLLPQVPVEWQWNEEEFLCQCCLKAGLPPDSWLTSSTTLYTFQAVIFEEEKPKGSVRRKLLGRN